MGAEIVRQFSQQRRDYLIDHLTCYTGSHKQTGKILIYITYTEIGILNEQQFPVHKEASTYLTVAFGSQNTLNYSGPLRFFTCAGFSACGQMGH